MNNKSNDTFYSLPICLGMRLLLITRFFNVTFCLQTEMSKCHASEGRQIASDTGTPGCFLLWSKIVNQRGGHGWED